MKNFRRIPVGDFRIGREERKAVKEVLDAGRVSEYKKVCEFEKKFADFIGRKHSVLLNSGTSALIAGLTALRHHRDLNIKPGQKIITTPLTYIATSNAIKLCGFEPVYIDVDPENLNISPEGIRAHLKKKKTLSQYGLILPVHLMGFPCDMDNINKIAREYDLEVMEDASQAHGTVYKGKRAGAMSLLSTFSFYIAHNIQVGEMGAVVTNNREIASLVKRIKANGRICDCPVCTRNSSGCPPLRNYSGDDDFDPRFTHTLIGYNFKTSEFSAALGVSQLKKAEEIKRKRGKIVEYLNNHLKKYSRLLRLPQYSEEISYLAYPLIIKRPDIISRKVLRLELEKEGIETRPFSSIPTQQPAYSYLKRKYRGKLPHAEYIGRHGFYIGCQQYLEKEDLDYIGETFEKILTKIK